MPTSKPRLTITMDQHQYELVKRLAAINKQSASSILLELLDTVAPVLERVVVASEAVQKAQASIKPNLRRIADHAEAVALPMAEASMAQLDMFLALVTEGAVEHGSPSAASATSADASVRRRPEAADTPRPVITGGRSETNRKPKKTRKPVAPMVSRKTARGVKS